MSTEEIIFVVIIVLILAVFLTYVIWFKIHGSRSHRDEGEEIEVKRTDIEVLAKYVKLQQQKKEEDQHLNELAKANLKEKLELYKQTREQLQEKLKKQLDAKEWKPLESILNSIDKGGVGIYVIYNETKNKYYVGQAKQIFKRVRDHFAVDDIVRDRIAGDKFEVKFLTANELDGDYRLDHIEKTGILIYNSDRAGYNKTNGNV